MAGFAAERLQPATQVPQRPELRLQLQAAPEPGPLLELKPPPPLLLAMLPEPQAPPLEPWLKAELKLLQPLPPARRLESQAQAAAPRPLQGKQRKSAVPPLWAWRPQSK
jgi:hypothetical protein